MMAKQEHIDYWIFTANKDWEALLNMYQSKDYVQALFFSHLVLEKLCKAHWVKDNDNNTPPKTHNLLVLLENTKLKITEEDTVFFRAMNQFQLEGIYPDYANTIYKTYKAENTKLVLDNVNIKRLWLLENL
jgi:HEPN domain-containing protein